jgi:hypothetical protein
MVFANNASLALPEPFGPLVAGALSVANLFFGETNGPDTALRQAFASTVQAIENQYVAGELASASANIQTAARWLNDHMTAVQDLQDMDTASTFVQQVISDISTVDQPTAPLPTALTLLNRPQFLSDPVNGQAAYGEMVAGIGIYLTYLRLRVQMQAWQVSASSNDDLDYGWFDVFRQEVTTWASAVANQIAQYQSARLAQVGPVEKNGKDFNFKDAGPRPTAAGPVTVKGWAGSNFATQAQAEAGRQSYITQVEAALQDQYGGDAAAVRKWVDQLQTWQDGLPPLQPAQAPYEAQPPVWGGALPSNSNWVSGSSVSYAVTFKNDGGESPLSAWSDPIAITTQAFPTLVLPTDPMQLATSRHVHRRFQGGADTVVAIVPENTTTTWQDETP